MKNIFTIGEPIYKIAMDNKLLPYVTQEIAARGWSDNAVITKEMSEILHMKQKANAKMLSEHGSV